MKPAQIFHSAISFLALAPGMTELSSQQGKFELRLAYVETSVNDLQRPTVQA